MLMGTIWDVGMFWIGWSGGGVEHDDEADDKLFVVEEFFIRFGTIFNKSGYMFKSFSSGSWVTETEMKMLPNGGLLVVKGKC